jgi:hypothetical protein
VPETRRNKSIFNAMRDRAAKRLLLLPVAAVAL